MIVTSYLYGLVSHFRRVHHKAFQFGTVIRQCKCAPVAYVGASQPNLGQVAAAIGQRHRALVAHLGVTQVNHGQLGAATRQRRRALVAHAGVAQLNLGQLGAAIRQRHHAIIAHIVVVTQPKLYLDFVFPINYIYINLLYN